MRKETSNNRTESYIDVKIPKEEAQLVRDILILEKSNVEAHRIAHRKEATDYEKDLMRIVNRFDVE